MLRGSFTESESAGVAIPDPMWGSFDESRRAGVATPDPMRGSFSESKRAGVAIPGPMRGGFSGSKREVGYVDRYSAVRLVFYQSNCQHYHYQQDYCFLRVATPDPMRGSSIDLTFQKLSDFQ